MKSYKNLQKFYSRILITRILIIGLNFLTTAYLITSMGNSKYGYYITVFSVVNWVFVLDLGIGKGMRNHLTNCLEKNDIESAKNLISTTLFVTTLLSVIFGFIFYILSSRYNIMLYLTSIDSSTSRVTLNIFMFVILLKLIFGVLDQILYSSQLSYITVYITFSVAIIFYIALNVLTWVGTELHTSYVAAAYLLSVIVSYLAFSFHFFKKNSGLLPSISSIDINLISDLVRSGIKIFAVQIMFFLILALDRFIILKYLDPDSAASYDILYRLMTIVLFPFSIIAQPLWSSYAAAKANRDIEWIRSIIRRLYVFSILILLSALAMSISFDIITDIWLNTRFDLSFIAKMGVGFLLFLTMWSTIHSDILFGVGAHMVMGFSILLGLVAKIVVLCLVALGDSLNLELIIMSSIFGYAVFAIVAPFYVKNLLKRT